VELKLNRTYQLLLYANDVNLLGDNIDAIGENTETIIDTSRMVGLEENTEKTKYMMKNAFFWDVAPCSFCVNRRFGSSV
jgi:hypothetical protein